MLPRSAVALNGSAIAAQQPLANLVPLPAFKGKGSTHRCQMGMCREQRNPGVLQRRPRVKHSKSYGNQQIRSIGFARFYGQNAVSRQK